MDELDLRERGGRQQVSDRRLFMNLLAFGDCSDCSLLGREMEAAHLEGVIYENVNDATGVGLLTWHEDPAFFVTTLRSFLGRAAFRELTPRLEYSMLGRTYALGHEPDLEDWLFGKPRRTATNREWPWAVWYPLRRRGAFSALPAEEQTPILREHGKIGHAFGEAGYAHDIRLACFGLDPNDNDFVIGLIGRELYPLSACVQAMRRTRQTSEYIEKMGPFFVGRAVWQSEASARPAQ